MVVFAVKGKRLVLVPGAHDQLVRFGIFIAGQAGNLAVAIIGVHRSPDRKAGQQAPAGNHVQHGKFFRHPKGWIVQGQRVANHGQGGLGGTAGQAGGNDIRRGHQAIAVLVMLVDANAIIAERVRVFELVHIFVVDKVALVGVVQLIGNIHPDGMVFFAKIIRQTRPRHKIKPGEFHCFLRFVGGVFSTIACSESSRPCGEFQAEIFLRCLHLAGSRQRLHHIVHQAQPQVFLKG